MEKTQLLLLTHNVPNDLTFFPEYLGHTQRRQVFKFIPRTYLQTAGWLIPRLELCTLQTCLTNLQTEISLTFELRRESWPSFNSRLHSLIFSTRRCPFPSTVFQISLIPSSAPQHIKKINHSACKKVSFFYLFVLMGESESLYGGLDRSSVYAAQPVLQLQELL